MRGDRKFCQRGSNFDNVFCGFFCVFWGSQPLTMFFIFFFFLVDELNDDPNSTKSGPSSARQRNAI